MLSVRMKTVIFIFLIISPGPFFIAAAVGKSGFRDLPCFLSSFLALH